MASRPRSLTGRIRDQLAFSVGAVLVLFLVLRVFGVRSSVAGIALSILLTLALNVGLAAWGEARSRRTAQRPRQAPRERDADIRWRDDER